MSTLRYSIPIEHTDELPFSSIGLLRMHFVWQTPDSTVADGWYRGTGALLNSTTVLTCSHNLTRQVKEEKKVQDDRSLPFRPRGYADQIRFYRAWSHSEWPSYLDAYTSASYAVYSERYYQGGESGLGENDWDVGIVRLAQALDVKVPFTMNIVKSDEDPAVKDNEFDLTGYPKDSNGQMMTDRDEVNWIKVQFNTLLYTHETMGGDSGAPVYKYSRLSPDVINQYGIHVEGKGDSDYENRRGTAITEAVYKWVYGAGLVNPTSFMMGYQPT